MKLRFLLYVIAFFNAVLLSQVTDYSFEHLTTDDGLSQTTVFKVFKDSKGYIWVCTQEGLNRYDGYSFKVFKFDPLDPNSIVGNKVNDIREDFDGNLWVATTSGLCVFNVKTENFKLIDKSKGFIGRNINSLYIYEDSTIYICHTQGLSIYHINEDRFDNYIGDKDTNTVIAQNVTDIVRTRDNKVYIALVHDKIQMFDPVTKEFTDIDYKKKYFGFNKQKKIFEDIDGNIWIGSVKGGLHKYNPTTKESKVYGIEEGFSSLNTHGGFNMANKDELLIGCRSSDGGICKLNIRTDSITYIRRDLKNNILLKNNSITNIFIDDQGIFWFGTYGGGVNIMNKYRLKFKTHKHNPLNPNSVHENPLLCVFEDSNGRIWIGSDGRGVCYYDRHTETYKHYSTKDGIGITSDVIKSIGEDAKGNILIGSFNGGLMILDEEKNKVKSYKSNKKNPGSIKTNNVWNIFRDSKNRIWLSILHGGLDLFEPEKGTFKHFDFAEDGRPPLKSPSFILEDDAGKLWISTYNSGIYIFDTDKNEVEQLTHDPDDVNTLSSSDIRSMVFDNNYLWVGTNGSGLDRYDIITSNVKHYTTEDGLPSNSIMSLVNDENGIIWGSTTNGIFKFYTRNDSIKSFDIHDGLQGKEFKPNAFSKLKDGNIIFAGVNGFNLFHPDDIKNNEFIPPIVFSDFKINNESATFGSDDSLLKYHIDYINNIALTHKQSVFTIHYSAINYTSTTKNLYRYKLEGFDKDWIEAGHKRSASYTNLDPGKYVFRVIASNNDKIWNTKGRELYIRVKPPWWKTMIFKIFITLLLVTSVISGIKYREYKISRDKEILRKKISKGEEEVNKQKSEIEKQKIKLKEKEKAEKLANWTNKGMAIFGEIISENKDNLENLSRKLITQLVKYIHAAQGALYIAKKGKDNNEYLELEGYYAVDLDKIENKIIHPGEGLVGSCFKTKEVVEVDNVPEDYSVFSSGLGELQISNLLLIPIKSDEQANGVIEITSFEKLEQSKIEFIKKISDSLSSTIHILLSSNEKSKLLHSANLQAEELMAQQEEMYQHLEELAATQEEMERLRTNELKKEEEFTKKKEELLGKIAELESKVTK